MRYAGTQAEQVFIQQLNRIKAPPQHRAWRGVIGFDWDNTLAYSEHSIMDMHQESVIVGDEADISLNSNAPIPFPLKQKGPMLDFEQYLFQDPASLNHFSAFPMVLLHETQQGLNTLCCFPRLRSPKGGNRLGPYDYLIPNAIALVVTLWILHYYGYYCINASQRIVIGNPWRMEFMLSALDAIFGSERFFLSRKDTINMRQLCMRRLLEYAQISNKDENPDKSFFLDLWSKNKNLWSTDDQKINFNQLYLVDDCRDYQTMLDQFGMNFVPATTDVYQPFKNILNRVLTPEEIKQGIKSFFEHTGSLALYQFEPMLQNLIQRPEPVPQKLSPKPWYRTVLNPGSNATRKLS